jgi:hypothetical protein
MQIKYHLSVERREKVYLTVAHFNILMEHRWQKDWYQPRHSGTLVNDHALDLSSIYTSARLSEFLQMRYRVSLTPSRRTGQNLCTYTFRISNLEFLEIKKDGQRLA